MTLLGPSPYCAGERPLFTVERSSIEPPEWSAYSVTPMGGVGARCFGPVADRREAEAWAISAGILADPIDEAA